MWYHRTTISRFHLKLQWTNEIDSRENQGNPKNDGEKQKHYSAFIVNWGFSERVNLDMSR